MSLQAEPPESAVRWSARRAAPHRRKRWPRGDALARLAPLLVAVAALASWEIASRTGHLSELLYPAPAAIAAALAEMIENGTLARHLGASLGRITAGALLGGGVGLTLGLAMGLSRRVRLALDPLVAAAHPIPKLALLPLVFLLFGLGEAARIAVVAISCFFPMLINSTSGVRQIEPLHFEVARNFGARWRQVLFYVVLPGSLPAVTAGTRLALIGALRTTLGIELLAAPSGLGHLVWFSWESFNSADLYATLFVIAVLGFSMSWVLQRWVARFHPDRSPASR